MAQPIEIAGLQWSNGLTLKSPEWTRLPRCSLCGDEGKVEISVTGFRQSGVAPLTYGLRLGGQTLTESTSRVNLVSYVVIFPATGEVAFELNLGTASLRVSTDPNGALRVRVFRSALPDFWREYVLERTPNGTRAKPQQVVSALVRADDDARKRRQHPPTGRLRRALEEHSGG